MASLEKLDIWGIRSFGNGPDEKQSITFEKPLTLIQGENGCGKSTIIECLRYVTAQKEPSGKGVFVHDPYLTASNTVKGQVKLLFKDARDREIHLAKSIQGIRKLKNVSTKNLDATISMDGENFSNRCVDIGSEITRLLGISKPILENVIFCTQDDALWPLDTDLNVKTRFDQIFDSEKHNKCLKKLRDKRKDLSEKKTLCARDLVHLKQRKDEAVQKRSQLKSLEDEIKNQDEEIERLEVSLIPIQEKIKAIEVVEKELSEAHFARKTVKTQLEECEKVQRDLKAKIQKASCEFRGTDEELEAALQDCDVQTRNVVASKQELDRLKIKENELSRNITQTSGKIGELKQRIDMNQNLISEKQSKMRELANMMGMTSTHLSEDGLERRVESKKTELANLVKAHEISEESLQKEVEKAKENLTKQQFELRSLEKSLMENNNEMDELKNQLKNAEAYQERRLRVVEDLNKADAELEKHKKQSNGEELAAKVQSLTSEVARNEKELNDVENELKLLQVHSEVSGKCTRLKTEYEAKITEVRRLRNHWHDVLIDVLGTVPDCDYKTSVQSTMDKINRELRDLNSRKTLKETELIKLKSSMQSLNDVMLKKRAEYQKYQDEVNELTNGEDLDHTVERTKNAAQNLQDEKGALSSSQVIYERYIRTLTKQNPCCPLCKRDFAAEQEAALLVQSLRSNMRDIPTKMATVESDIKKTDLSLQKLYSYHSVKETMERINSVEIPSLIREHDDKKNAATRVRGEVDDLDKEMALAEKNREACTSSLGDMALLDQCVDVVAKLKREIEQLERELPKDWNKDKLVKAEERRDSLASSRRTNQKERDSVQDRLSEYNAKLVELQGRKHQLAEEEIKLRSSSGQKKQQEDRLAQLLTQASTTQIKIKEFKSVLPPLETSCQVKLAELREKKESNKSEAREAQVKLNELNDQLRDIRRMQREITNFEEKREDVRLEELNSSLNQKESDAQALKIQIESLNAKIGDFSKSEVRRRELEDNKSLRQKKADMIELQDKLTALERKIQGFGYHPEEKSTLRQETEKIGQRISRLNGSKGAVESNIVVLKKEIKDRYHDIDFKFRKSLVDMKVAEAASSDLMRYVSAMEYAIGKYHEEQMIRVNTIIREYWRKIYRGNDIDYIEILAEQKEMLDTRRMYNYNLVQKKGDAMMEMRYRCSAGQKMLACLIVRMALAEVFSSNCGILALDEPTTNLDRKNIRNLANTLNDLIAAKEGLQNSNFQLIVITHDKEFLNELMSVNAVDRYVEVSRTREGKSQLKVKFATRD